MIKIHKKLKVKQIEACDHEFKPGDIAKCLCNLLIGNVNFYEGFGYEIDDYFTTRTGVRIVRINGSYCFADYFQKINS